MRGLTHQLMQQRCAHLVKAELGETFGQDIVVHTVVEAPDIKASGEAPAPLLLMAVTW